MRQKYCKQCGACCVLNVKKFDYTVSIEVKENTKIKKGHLKKDKERNYLTLTPLKKKWSGEDKVCPFLTEELRCKLHKTRQQPKVCRHLCCYTENTLYKSEKFRKFKKEWRKQ